MGSLMRQAMELINECRMLAEAVLRCECTPHKCATCKSNLERIERKLKVAGGMD